MSSEPRARRGGRLTARRVNSLDEANRANRLMPTDEMLVTQTAHGWTADLPDNEDDGLWIVLESVGGTGSEGLYGWHRTFPSGATGWTLSTTEYGTLASNPAYNVEASTGFPVGTHVRAWYDPGTTHPRFMGEPCPVATPLPPGPVTGNPTTPSPTPTNPSGPAPTPPTSPAPNPPSGPTDPTNPKPPPSYPTYPTYPPESPTPPSLPGVPPPYDPGPITPPWPGDGGILPPVLTPTSTTTPSGPYRDAFGGDSPGPGSNPPTTQMGSVDGLGQPKPGTPGVGSGPSPHLPTEPGGTTPYTPSTSGP